MTDAESGIGDVLREVIQRRGLKLTEIAAETGIPYRSLQNYLRRASRMPLAAYLDICRSIGVPPDYPIEKRFKLDHSALQLAIIEAAGLALDAIELDQDSRLTVRGSLAPHDEQHARRVAGFLAAIIAARYDVARELELFADEVVQ
jgi:transcriptional regulator with XRE-family HTH domain